MIFDYLFLPMLFLIGLITSYQDFYYGKIRNKWIFLGLGWGIAIFIISFIWTMSAPFFSDFFGRPMSIILSDYMFNVLLNAAISLAIGFLLWYFDAWSAGDAKLFFVFSLLLPLKYYQKSAFPYFPSVVLLVNTFLPVIFFLIMINICHLVKLGIGFLREKKIDLKKAIVWTANLLNKNKWRIFKILPMIFLMSFVFQLARIKFDFANDGRSSWLMVIFLLMSQLLGRLSKFFAKKAVLLILALVAIVYVFWVGPISFLDDFANIAPLLKNSFIFMPAFLIVSAILTKLPGQDKERKLPFAFWMFIGVLITMVFQGSIISFFIKQNF